jgi:putative ABC transport system permease protein
MIWLKLALKEIRNNPRFSWFFIVNLSLGLVGFIALNSFQISIQQHIANRSKTILSADLDIRSTYELEETDLAFLEEQIGPFLAKTRRIDFLSMVAGNQGSRLVQIQALDEGYPLYGDIVLKNSHLVTKTLLSDQLLKCPNIWVQPEILAALNIRTGDSVTIGAKKFRIADTVLDSSSGFVFTSGFAYSLFMGLEQAKETDLLRIGSRRSHHYFYQLPPQTDGEAVASRLQTAIVDRFGKNSYLSVNTHENAGRRMTRFLGYMNDYLGLVSLVALFLAGVGTAYLFRSYLSGNLKELAILMILGAEKKRTYLFLLLQLVILGSIAALLSVLLSYFFKPVLTALLVDFLPKNFQTVFSWQSVLLALAMGSLGSLLFCLPILYRIHYLKPMIVFNESLQSNSQSDRSDPIKYLSYLPLLIVFWLLAVWQSRSWFIGSIFMGSLSGAFIVLGMIGWLLVISANRVSSNIPLVFRLAFRNLHRNKTAVISSFLAIGLGSLLISLIPQIDYGLQKEMRKPETTNLPSFFLFDVQPDQVKLLQDFVVTLNYQIKNLSPWIESRLTHINGVEFSKFETTETSSTTREEHRRNHSRTRTQNLSYRSQLFDSEILVSGRPFTGVYNGNPQDLPEISLEESYSESLNVKIGNTLTFDVQGIPIEGKIVNIRKIKWQTMQPNFYVLFQPGVLEEAPSTFLGTIYNVKDEDKSRLQTGIVRQFSNISLVDIGMAVTKILEITEQISWAIQVMAFSAILVGMIVVYSIARYNSQSRLKEINLLKVLGAGFNDIRLFIVLEFCIFGFTASLVGTLLSLVAAWIMSYLIFDSIWAISFPILVFTVISVTLLTIIAAYWGTHKVLKQKPLSLLQAV